MARRVPPSPPPARRRVASPNGILYPLDAHYARMRVAPPVARRMPPARIPPPYHQLLVHTNEMTQTLEQYLGGRIALRVLSTISRGRWYSRRLLLVEESSGRPIALGAVRIRLDAFSARIRARILAERTPLGRVLRDGGVKYLSRPTVFFDVTPNAEMMAILWMREASTLYGRQTHLFLGDTRIGDIVEILPLL